MKRYGKRRCDDSDWFGYIAGQVLIATIAVGCAVAAIYTAWLVSGGAV